MVRWPVLVALLAATGCAPVARVGRTPGEVHAEARKRSPNKVFQGAFLQLAKPAVYDPAYYAIPYPEGDVPPDRGACADVVVRALRHAGRDLQALVHEDAKSGSYPAIKTPDTNIDHRRVLNLEVFFKRHGRALPTAVSPPVLAQWKPGDIVSWRLRSGQGHIGIVSDTKRPDGVPYVIHNIAQVAEEDALTRWRIVGHYRYP